MLHCFFFSKHQLFTVTGYYKGCWFAKTNRRSSGNLKSSIQADFVFICFAVANLIKHLLCILGSQQAINAERQQWFGLHITLWNWKLLGNSIFGHASADRLKTDQCVYSSLTSPVSTRCSKVMMPLLLLSLSLSKSSSDSTAEEPVEEMDELDSFLRRGPTTASSQSSCRISREQPPPSGVIVTCGTRRASITAGAAAAGADDGAIWAALWRSSSQIWGDFPADRRSRRDPSFIPGSPKSLEVFLLHSLGIGDLKCRGSARLVCEERNSWAERALLPTSSAPQSGHFTFRKFRRTSGLSVESLLCATSSLVSEPFHALKASVSVCAVLCEGKGNPSAAGGAARASTQFAHTRVRAPAHSLTQLHGLLSSALSFSLPG